jgi:hypothetical protein
MTGLYFFPFIIRLSISDSHLQQLNTCEILYHMANTHQFRTTEIPRSYFKSYSSPAQIHCYAIDYPQWMHAKFHFKFNIDYIYTLIFIWLRLPHAINQHLASRAIQMFPPSNYPKFYRLLSTTYTSIRQSHQGYLPYHHSWGDFISNYFFFFGAWLLIDDIALLLAILLLHDAALYEIIYCSGD